MRGFSLRPSVWNEPSRHSPFSPRGEGAGRRMRGTPEAKDGMRGEAPLIRPFGPPSPRGEKETGGAPLTRIATMPGRAEGGIIAAPGEPAR